MASLSGGYICPCVQTLGQAFADSMDVLQHFYEAFPEELELGPMSGSSRNPTQGVAGLKHNLIQQKLATPLSKPHSWQKCAQFSIAFSIK